MFRSQKHAEGYLNYYLKDIFLLLIRCRLEQRMKRLAELKAKNTPIITQISTPEPTITGTMSPEGVYQAYFSF
jgi:hypothetical protein